MTDSLDKNTSINIGLFASLIVTIVAAVFWVQSIVAASGDETREFVARDIAHASNAGQEKTRALEAMIVSITKTTDEKFLNIQRRMDDARIESQTRSDNNLKTVRADWLAMREAIENSGLQLRKVLPSTGEVIVAEPRKVP